MHRHFSLLILVVLASSPVASEAAVIAGPIPNGGSVYYLLSSNTWVNAEAEAFSLGGHLATINDAAEHAWVLTTFENYGAVPRSLWFGLTDQFSEGNFQWVSGEPVTFTAWAAGEPNQCAGEEDYVHTFPPGDSRNPFWNDLLDNGCGGCGQCFGPPNGVVEVPLSTTVLPGTWGKVKALYR